MTGLEIASVFAALLNVAVLVWILTDKSWWKYGQVFPGVLTFLNVASLLVNIDGTNLII